jgi:hypothetical protein
MGDIPAALFSSMERAPWGWVLMVTILLALIKTWPIINAQLIAVKDRIKDREERKQNEAINDKTADLSDCKSRLDAMDLRLTAAEERAHRFELQLVATLTAYRIVEAETETERPQSPALKQARRVLQDVFRITGDMPTDMTVMIAKV